MTTKPKIKAEKALTRRHAMRIYLKYLSSIRSVFKDDQKMWLQEEIMRARQIQSDYERYYEKTYTDR